MTRLRIYKGGALEEQDSLLRRQVLHRQEYERWERRDRMKRQLAIVGLIVLIALGAATLGYIAGAGWGS